MCTQLNGTVTRPVTCNFSCICASELGVYFTVCTGLTSNHFLDNTSALTCAAVSRANRYQALPLIFYSPLDRGDSLGTRLAENSQIMSSPSSGDRKDHIHFGNESSKLENIFLHESLH